MKKETRNKLIALFFGIMMLGSTATYALMQAFNLFGTSQQSQTGQLPSSYIVQEKLSDAVEQLIMSEKGTVVQFYYSSNCLDCVRQRNVLESYVNQNQGQIYLEEIQTSSSVSQNIIIKSLLNEKTLTNASESDIQNAFCDVLIHPPAACVLKNLNTS
jgi:hypothetical protein